MSIIITKDGNQTAKLERSTFVDEGKLQEYIHNNPESIPVSEIEAGLNLLILAREFQTNSGPIDALGVDQKGNLYIIETKLYTNADKRRVLAQALDYGAALWKHSNDFSEFLRDLDMHTGNSFKQSVNEKLAQYFNLDETALEVVLSQLEINLTAGRFRFMVLMDSIDERLKDLILYVNQNSAFDVYAVELEYYRHENQEIIIPRLFGAEVKKDVGKTRTEKKRWDWESFKEERLMQFGNEAVNAAAEIIEWSTQHGIDIEWSNSQRGSFIMCFHISNTWGFYPFTINGDGTIGWNAPHQGDKAPEPFNDPEMRREIINRISAIPGATTDPDNVNGYKGLGISLQLLAVPENKKVFYDTCIWIREELNKIHTK